MQRALEHARIGLGRTTPNPVVGACVVTSDGIVVREGGDEPVDGLPLRGRRNLGEAPVDARRGDGDGTEAP